jgi:hypothetical protein
MRFDSPLLNGLVLLACAALLAGCGEGDNVWTGSTGTVSGTVTFQEKPVAEGQINLYDKTRGVGASADITDGKFQIAEPVPAGSYEVTILPPPPPLPTGEEVTVDPPKTNYADIPVQYRSGTTSGLVAEIKEGDNTLSFDLTPQ